jgi:hypothetical protein
MPYSIRHGDACLALFNKNWGIPSAPGKRRLYIYVEPLAGGHDPSL